MRRGWRLLLVLPMAAALLATAGAAQAKSYTLKLQLRGLSAESSFSLVISGQDNFSWNLQSIQPLSGQGGSGAVPSVQISPHALKFSPGQTPGGQARDLVVFLTLNCSRDCNLLSLVPSLPPGLLATLRVGNGPTYELGLGPLNIPLQ